MRSLNIKSLNSIALSEFVLLVEVNPVFEYADSKRTDKQIGTAFSVVCPSNSYHRLVVKTSELNPVITSEQLEEIGATTVTFEGFNAKIYPTSGQLGISCTADKMVLE